MRGSPIQNFICVLILLAVMATGVFLTTRSAEAQKPAQASATTINSADITQSPIDAEILFSHRPTHISIQQVGKGSPVLDLKPTSNEVDFSLTVPAKQVTELLIDVQWPDAPDGSKYFTRITLRQDGKEDQIILFSDQFADFSDTFSIHTH